MPLPSKIVDVTQLHLEQLLADSTAEGSHLEFKRDLPINWDQGTKHEFLADVSAFANSGGGDLIFGIDENGQGQAQAIVPQALENPDQQVRRLQDFLLTLVEPRLPGVQIQAIPVIVDAVSGHAVIVRTPQSWVGPHRVKTNQHFFVRDGLRKRQLDVPEVRSLFLRSESQAQRVRDFRTERLGKILTGETPHRLVDAPFLVAHFVTTQAALGLVQIDPVPYLRDRNLPVVGGRGMTTRINIDGALAIRNETPNRETNGYTQLFRNGFFESTYAITYRPNQGRVTLPSLSYEQDLINLLSSYRAELTHIGVDFECTVMLSITRANEVKLGINNDWDLDGDYQTLFDRGTVVIPEIVASGEETPARALRAAFDLVWQAAGFASSRNYDHNGEWNPRR